MQKVFATPDRARRVTTGLVCNSQLIGVLEVALRLRAWSFCNFAVVYNVLMRELELALCIRFQDCCPFLSASLTLSAGSNHWSIFPTFLSKFCKIDKKQLYSLVAFWFLCSTDYCHDAVFQGRFCFNARIIFLVGAIFELALGWPRTVKWEKLELEQKLVQKVWSIQWAKLNLLARPEIWIRWRNGATAFGFSVSKLIGSAIRGQRAEGFLDQ